MSSVDPSSATTLPPPNYPALNFSSADPSGAMLPEGSPIMLLSPDALALKKLNGTSAAPGVLGPLSGFELMDYVITVCADFGISGPGRRPPSPKSETRDANPVNKVRFVRRYSRA